MAEILSTPMVNMAPYLDGHADAQELCRVVARALTDYGQVMFHDPRVDFSVGERFMAEMHKFFAKPASVKERCRMRHCSHQTGWTPPGSELSGAAKGDKDDIIAALAPEHRPMPVTEADKKERMAFPIGPRLDAEKHGFHEFNSSPFVVPQDQPEMLPLALQWGESMRQACFSLLEMAALGWGEPADFFTKRMQHGPHLLAPTGSDMIAHGKPGTVLAGFHNDMSFCTLMSRASGPGLFAWTTDGRRYAVRLPPTYLLLQCGRQKQWVTGGVANRVFHEVLSVEEYQAAIEEAIRLGVPLWRIAIPMFFHMDTNQVAAPDGIFKTPEACAKFLAFIIGERARQALRMRELGTD